MSIFSDELEKATGLNIESIEDRLSDQFPEDGVKGIKGYFEWLKDTDITREEALLFMAYYKTVGNALG